MRKKKPPMFQIILNEQTPKTSTMDDPQKWIKENQIKLNSFLSLSRSKDKAAGLASNQVAFHGERITDRFFAIRNSKNMWSLVINPELKSINGDAEVKEEGCLTWPGKTIIANRHPGIIVSFWKQDGSFVENEFLTGYEAQVWQHETCHLNGVPEKFKTNKIERKAKVPGRNDKCPCGSGIKFKKCCGK